MLRIIDLDASPKDCDGIVFTLTLNGEKAGFSDQELAEMIRTRHGASAKNGAKKVPARGKAATSQTDVADDGSEADESLPSQAGVTSLGSDHYGAALNT